MGKTEQVDLKLGRDEAMVLFEMLASFEKQPYLEIGDAAERLSLIRLSGALEGLLTEPFAPDYKAVLDEARSRLVEQFGDQDR